MKNTRKEEIEHLFKIPVAIKKDQAGHDWVYLIYFASNEENGSMLCCSINGDARSMPMANKRISRAKYTMLTNVALDKAEEYLKQYCNYYGLDVNKFVLVTKMPTLQFD